jgi:hypothetical protein
MKIQSALQISVHRITAASIRPAVRKRKPIFPVTSVAPEYSSSLFSMIFPAICLKLPAPDNHDGRPVQLPDQGVVVEGPEAVGLHHHYERRAA